jgi:hypothetical protein
MDPARHPTTVLPAYQTSVEPPWKLLMLFDAMILHPTTSTDPRPDPTVLQRLAAFRHGDIQPLHTQAINITPPLRSNPPTFTDNDMPCKAAQALANDDNYRSAYQRVQASLPTATMTPAVRQRCEKLYPARITLADPVHPQHFTRGSTHNYPTFPLDDANIHRALSSLKRGTAGGPFSDLTDILKSYALHSPATQADEEPTLPHFTTFTKIIGLILNNRVPPLIARLLRSNRFIAFHKDPDDQTKLRPIGIGTAYRRVVGAVITTTYAPDFAELLLP